MKNTTARLACVIGLTGLVFAAAAARAQTAPPLPTQEEPEVLAQGPVHEAFAEPVNLSEEGTLTAPTAPPGAIAENVPDERPSPQAVWVPGYWAWDAGQRVYIWVSGCWRVVPAGKRWVPGYWTPTDKGWVWTSGYWAAAETASQRTEYLPPPPPLEQAAPPAVAPNAEVIWVPSCWYWHQGGYVLRSGYWLNANPGWVWQPSHYVWTPRGHVFVQGYWDYPLTSRGVLYAPVRIPEPVFLRPGFSLSLGVSVNLGWLELNLFSAPRYGHYFFGDYYDETYIGLGIFPWFHSRASWTWYDPIYEHRRWHGRKGGDSHWDDHDRRDFDRRRNDVSLRPPRTFREIEAREPHRSGTGKGPGRSPDRDRDRGSPLIRVRTDKGPAHRAEPVAVSSGIDRREPPATRGMPARGASLAPAPTKRGDAPARGVAPAPAPTKRDDAPAPGPAVKPEPRPRRGDTTPDAGRRVPAPAPSARGEAPRANPAIAVQRPLGSDNAPAPAAVRDPVTATRVPKAPPAAPQPAVAPVIRNEGVNRAPSPAPAGNRVPSVGSAARAPAPARAPTPTAGVAPAPTEKEGDFKWRAPKMR